MARPINLKPVKRGSSWDVSLPPSLSPTGRRKRKTFHTKVEADRYSQQQLQQFKNEGPHTIRFTSKEAVDAREALRILNQATDELMEPDGLSLANAAMHLVNFLKERQSAKAFVEVWEASLESRGFDTFSIRHRRDVRALSKKFLEVFGSTLISDISPEQIESFLNRTFTHKTQFNKAHRVIHPAFAYAVRRGYLSADPFVGISQKKVIRGSISLVRIEQVEKIADLCKGDFADCMPAIMIMMFAGVRPLECERLEWSAVKFDLDEPCIRITKAVAKGSLESARPRTIPMKDNLISWLKLIPKENRKRKIVAPNWTKKNTAFRSAAGFSGTQDQDILRHSFASYHLAYYNDENRTTASLGHGSSKMLFKHYDAAVERKPAIKFWNLYPDGFREPKPTGMTAPVEEAC